MCRVVAAYRLLFVVGLAAIVSCDSKSRDAVDGKSPARNPGKTSVGEAPETAIRFVDITPQTGVDCTPTNGEEAQRFAILESIGTGVGLLDFDRDGALDAIFPGGGQFKEDGMPSPRKTALFRNIADLQFEDATDAAKVGDARGYSHGCFVADFDNDGFQDVLLTTFDGPQLFRNLGDGSFEDATTALGLAVTRWSTAAAWGDFNSDGNPDVYVVNYVDWSPEKNPRCEGFGGARDICSPGDFEPLNDALYISDGAGNFRLVDIEFGLVSGGKGLGAIASDLDGDGHVDVYVANDTTPNFLYANRGGQFAEVGIANGAALNPSASADGSMGIDMADLNGDGRPDLWVTNYEHQSNAFYRNDGDMIFQHVSDRAGITAIGKVYVGFGTVANDFDRDGDNDLFVTNGHVMLHSRNSPLRQHALLLQNNGSGEFASVSSSVGDYFTQAHRGRGVAVGDLDDDGLDDLIVTHVNDPVRVLRNTSRRSKDFIKVRLIGTTSSRDLVGASVTLTTPVDEQVRFVTSGASYLSSSDQTLTFAVPARAENSKIIVRWPTGNTTTFEVASKAVTVVVVERVGWFEL